MADNVSANYEQKSLVDNYINENDLRNVAIDQIEELKIQEKLLDGIYQNIKESIENIKQMKIALQQQDKQLEGIIIKVEEKIINTIKNR